MNIEVVVCLVTATWQHDVTLLCDNHATSLSKHMVGSNDVTVRSLWCWL